LFWLEIMEDPNMLSSDFFGTVENRK
jgi:hypothetical protein